MVRVEMLFVDGWFRVHYIRGPAVLALEPDAGCNLQMYARSGCYLAIHEEKGVFTALDFGYAGLYVDGEWVMPGTGRPFALYDVISYGTYKVRVVPQDPDEWERLSSAPTLPPAPRRVARPPRRRKPKPSATDPAPPEKKKRKKKTDKEEG